MNWKYCGIGWAKDHTTQTSLQSLCHLIAHEIIHTSDRIEWKRKNGRLQRQTVEFQTDNLAAEFVTKFAQHEEIGVWKRYRKARRTARNAEIRKAKAAAERKAPASKMARAEMNLKRWQDQEEKAKRMRKKWETKVNRIHGARRAATTRAANKNPKRDH